VLAQWRQAGVTLHKPVMILLTDSEDWVKTQSKKVLRQIMESEQKLDEAERLTVHVIGFGPDVDEGYIEALARIGNGSHLCCHAARDMDRLNLVQAFSTIAAHPAIKVSLLKQTAGGHGSEN
jgi:hypothetical protein